MDELNIRLDITKERIKKSGNTFEESTSN
jgi:hypothetical protein